MKHDLCRMYMRRLLNLDGKFVLCSQGRNLIVEEGEGEGEGGGVDISLVVRLGPADY